MQQGMRCTSVSLEPRKGMWPWLLSSARMHSLSASRLLLISAPSSRVCLPRTHSTALISSSPNPPASGSEELALTLPEAVQQQSWHSGLADVGPDTAACASTAEQGANYMPRAFNLVS